MVANGTLNMSSKQIRMTVMILEQNAMLTRKAKRECISACQSWAVKLSHKGIWY